MPLFKIFRDKPPEASQDSPLTSSSSSNGSEEIITPSQIPKLKRSDSFSKPINVSAFEEHANELEADTTLDPFSSPQLKRTKSLSFRGIRVPTLIRTKSVQFGKFINVREIYRERVSNPVQAEDVISEKAEGSVEGVMAVKKTTSNEVLVLEVSSYPPIENDYKLELDTFSINSEETKEPLVQLDSADSQSSSTILAPGTRKPLLSISTFCNNLKSLSIALDCEPLMMLSLDIDKNDYHVHTHLTELCDQIHSKNDLLTKVNLEQKYLGKKVEMLLEEAQVRENKIEQLQNKNLQFESFEKTILQPYLKRNEPTVEYSLDNLQTFMTKTLTDETQHHIEINLLDNKLKMLEKEMFDLTKENQEIKTFIESQKQHQTEDHQKFEQEYQLVKSEFANKCVELSAIDGKYSTLEQDFNVCKKALESKSTQLLHNLQEEEAKRSREINARFAEAAQLDSVIQKGELEIQELTHTNESYAKQISQLTKSLEIVTEEIGLVNDEHQSTKRTHESKIVVALHRRIKSGELKLNSYKVSSEILHDILKQFMKLVFDNLSAMMREDAREYFQKLYSLFLEKTTWKSNDVHLLSKMTSFMGRSIKDLVTNYTSDGAYMEGEHLRKMDYNEKLYKEVEKKMKCLSMNN